MSLRNHLPLWSGGEAVGVGSGGFGFEEDNPYGLAWVAINSAPNAWPHVGSKDNCLKYDFIHNGPPMWGVTGEENKEITRHIVCCPPTSTSKKSEKDAYNDPDNTPPIIPNPWIIYGILVWMVGKVPHLTKL